MIENNIASIIMKVPIPMPATVPVVWHSTSAIKESAIKTFVILSICLNI
jgi:hypothetical protein